MSASAGWVSASAGWVSVSAGWVPILAITPNMTFDLQWCCTSVVVGATFFKSCTLPPPGEAAADPCDPRCGMWGGLCHRPPVSWSTCCSMTCSSGRSICDYQPVAMATKDVCHS